MGARSERWLRDEQRLWLSFSWQDCSVNVDGVANFIEPFDAI